VHEDRHFERQASGIWRSFEGYTLELDEGDHLVVKDKDGRPLIEPDPYRFELFDPTTLQSQPVPQRQWLVPDWFALERVVGLYGEPGTNKTTLAQNARDRLRTRHRMVPRPADAAMQFDPALL